MKEIDQQETPDVSGGYRDVCIPQPLPVLPSPEDPYGGIGDFPKNPGSPWAADIYVTDPPAV